MDITDKIDFILQEDDMNEMALQVDVPKNDQKHLEDWLNKTIRKGFKIIDKAKNSLTVKFDKKNDAQKMMMQIGMFDWGFRKVKA